MCSCIFSLFRLSKFGITFASYELITINTHTRILHFLITDCMSTIDTIIADKQVLFREGLKLQLRNTTELRLNFIRETESSEQLLQYVAAHKPNLVILDLNLSKDDGIEVLPKLLKLSPYTKVIVLTSYSNHKFVKGAMKSGADGYLLKSHSIEDLKDAILDVLDNRTYLGAGLHITPPNNYSTTSEEKSRFEDRFMIRRRLTKREQEILALITQAKNNKEIAQELYISDQTVGVHRKNIMRKLGVRNTVNLIKFTFENQLV